MSKAEVLMAEPYRPMAMGSFGKASYMLITQHQFPHKYDRHKDVLLAADHDRCFQWDYAHAERCFKEHGSSTMGFEGWVQSAAPEEMIAFLKDILKADEQYPDTEWTGFRIMGTVNRSNGYPVWSLDLFANRSGTKVYSSGHAPNVKGFEECKDKFFVDVMGKLRHSFERYGDEYDE